MKTISSVLLILVAVANLCRAEDQKIKTLWYEDCSRCHAPDGSGNCPLGKTLKVRDYSSKQAQAQFSDAEIEKLLKEGKIRSGKKVMPSYELSSQEVVLMTNFIRSLSKS